jgi:hypothetical protein
MRRALILGALLAAAIAPAAQAAPSSLVVQAAAQGHFGGFEQMRVHFECSAKDTTGAATQLTSCTFGPLSAPLPKGLVQITTGGGIVRAGWPYDLCVSATSYHVSGPLTVSKCGAYDSLTGKVLIGY